MGGGQSSAVPRIPAPAGPAGVVGRVRFRVPEGTMATVFYPARDIVAIPGNAQRQRQRWRQRKRRDATPHSRREAARGVAAALQLGPRAKKALANAVCVNVIEDAAPAAPAAQDGKLGIVVFSHGQNGHSEWHTKVCSDMASHGNVVLAVEHEDGSAAYAQEAGAREPVRILAPPRGMDASVRSNVGIFRAPFLAQRRQELLAALRLVVDADVNAMGPELVRLAQLLRLADRSAAWLAGHSLGAASVVYASAMGTSMSVEAHRVKGLVLLDLCVAALPEEVTDAGFPRPALLVTSEEFEDNCQLHTMLGEMMAVRGTFRAAGIVLNGCSHLQLSDAAFTLPGVVGGTGADPRVQSAVGDAIATFLREGDRADMASVVKRHQGSAALYPRAKERVAKSTQISAPRRVRRGSPDRQSVALVPIVEAMIPAATA